MALVQWLKDRQAERGWSDGQFADFLGIDRATWNVLKNGHREPSFRTYRAAINAFPDCEKTIISFALGVNLRTRRDPPVTLVS